MISPGDAARAGPARIAVIDAVRGAALLGMFVYHITWDLGFFQFIDGDIPLSPSFHLYAHVVASAFLILVGTSLVLAARGGLDWAAYAERLVWIVACAVAISLGTWFLFPSDLIFFGILHCIAVASLLALPFLWAPAWLCGLAAAACFAAPALLASTAFDRPSLWWTGLGTRPPTTYDYRPLLPWAGMVLLGVVATRLLLPRFERTAAARWRPHRWPARVLCWGGRHSLFVYVVHQPIFLGLLLVLFQFVGPSMDVAARPFERACNAQCVAAGSAAPTCQSICRCIVDRSRSSGLLRNVLADRLSADDKTRFNRLRVDCVRLPTPASQLPPPNN